MSRQTMTTILLGEVYAATRHDHPVPMHPRRIKRLLNMDRGCAETMNRCAAAWLARRIAP